MKENIHPDYHDIKVVMTDGTEYTTKSCWGKAGDVMRLDIDPLNHPAWTGGNAQILEKGRLTKFGNKYAGLGVAGTDKLETVKTPSEKKSDKKSDEK